MKQKLRGRPRNSLRGFSKVELHQHVDGSIPVDLTWNLMSRHSLQPVSSLKKMKKLLVLQRDEQGTLLNYLDKFHYPLWITQFYENIARVVEAIVLEAFRHGVRILELRYSPVIHTYAGLTLRQTLSAALSGINRAKRRCAIQAGLIVIAMRQHGPHIAKILARQAISEAQQYHERTGVVGFDIAGAERGNPPGLFAEAYRIARSGRLGLTAHVGEDEGPGCIWQAIEDLGVQRVGHGCSAVQDKVLLRRLARDRIMIECCLTSNYQTGAVKQGKIHPIYKFMEFGIPVSICTDNTTVSNTDQSRENRLLLDRMSVSEIKQIHTQSRAFSFIKSLNPR